MRNEYQHSVYHVRWGCSTERFGELSGLVGVKLYQGRVTIRNLAGNALVAGRLLDVLNLVLPADWQEVAENWHLQRKYPWRVSTRQGESGCVDYILRYLRDEDVLDQPIGGLIHVSMWGKLNRGVSLWLGDLPPLLAALLKDFPPQDFPARACVGDYLEAYRPQKKGEYSPPGMKSGLQAALDGLGIKRI